MRPDEALEKLKQNIIVTRQRVTIAKAFILKNFEENASSLINHFLREMEARMPSQVVIHQTVDTDTTLSQAAEAISWKLAACEAIWGLIATGLVIPGDSDLSEQLQTLSWTTVTPGSGGQSSGWQLEDLSLPVPRRILLPRSSQNQMDQPLSDPDLFLHTVDIPNLSEEVNEALREAVRCFRHDLYLASLTMLGKASEGAWMELGFSLLKAIPPDGPVNIEKIRSKIEAPFISIAKKIVEIVKLYERKDLLESIQKGSGVTLQDLRNSMIWSDAVRESRNSVHYGVKPSMPNKYEKVAALLIGAVPHLRLLYSIMSTVDSCMNEVT